jgi:hypothetical protein
LPVRNRLLKKKRGVTRIRPIKQALPRNASENARVGEQRAERKSLQKIWTALAARSCVAVHVPISKSISVRFAALLAPLLTHYTPVKSVAFR